MTKKPGKGVPLRRASQKLVIALVLAVFIAGAASAQWGGWGSSSGGGGWWSNQNYGRAQPRQRRRAVQQYAPQPTYQPQQQYNPFYPSAQQPTAQYPRASTPSRKRARRTPPVMAYAPPDDRETRRSRSPSARAGIRIRRSSRGENPRDPAPYYSGIKYCVRLCDGRFFELSDPGRMKPEEMCSALCPASATKVFRGSPIEEATAADGARYEKLKNAFLFRQKLVADCTCNGKTAYGLAKIDIKSDPTLQAGDIVVMADGLSVYSGTRGRRRNSAARFTPLRKSSLISQSFRRTLNRIEIAKTRPKVQAHQDEPDAPDLTD